MRSCRRSPRHGSEGSAPRGCSSASSSIRSRGSCPPTLYGSRRKSSAGPACCKGMSRGPERRRAVAEVQWIPIAFVAAIVLVTIGLGIWATRISHTASDVFVAGRSVSAFWNASAISGEYLSAASFMGVAGMVMRYGYDTLWYPVSYAAGYLLLLLFIAGPLRRFGAYTIADFAEGRFDSPTFRRIAVTFVLFIGFFYTMPQMKGAGITLNSILGVPYAVGVILVGGVIAFNVALGGMRGITLVQAFQYWVKMFAIAAPVFVLMAVTGGYHQHLGTIKAEPAARPTFREATTLKFKGAQSTPANTVAFPPAAEIRF